MGLVRTVKLRVPTGLARLLSEDLSCFTGSELLLQPDDQNEGPGSLPVARQTEPRSYPAGQSSLVMSARTHARTFTRRHADTHNTFSYPSSSVPPVLRCVDPVVFRETEPYRPSAEPLLGSSLVLQRVWFHRRRLTMSECSHLLC